MDIRRIALYACLAFVSYTLWTTWQVEHPSTVSAQHSTVRTPNSTEPLLPTVVGESVDEHTTSLSSLRVDQDPDKLIQVKTDVLDVAIDLNHGDVVQAQLLAYPKHPDDKKIPVILLQNTTGERYVANSSLFVVDAQKIQSIDAHFTSDATSYQLQENDKELIVSLTGNNNNGLLIKKEFAFEKGSYLITVRYVLKNNSDNLWKGYMNTQLLRSFPKEDKSSLFHVGSYIGASYANPGHARYKKMPFKDMVKNDLDLTVEGGWFAMQQHYFLTAWIPPVDSKNRFYTRSVGGDYTIGAVSEPIVLEPTQEQSVDSQLYLGPEVASTLKAIAPGLDLTVDYGWLWFISAVLFSVMKAIHSVVGNWGWSIVLVMVLIKILFYRLSTTSYKSMAGMRQLQPKLLELRERYGDDKAKISQATMEMYRQEKVNPLGGCLPILIQIPVFIALYGVLLESIELRQAPFIFWITDLSAPDPFYVLPLIMGVSLFIQQKLNPVPPDPMQAKMMMFLPVLFTALFFNMPAGLVLYSIVNNSLSILQQWYITRKYGNNPTVPTKKTPKKLTLVK
jgi:YidC/Oxa1 family membrane protein insertase